MGTVEELISKLKELPEFVKVAATIGVEDNEEDIIDLNREQLTIRGVDSEGDDLGDYAPLSVELRSEKGLQTEFIDLRDTGAFQDSIKLEKRGDLDYEFNATDSKWANELQPRFPDALGITVDNEQKVDKIIISTIENQVEKFL